jgi:hypothetical protein
MELTIVGLVVAVFVLLVVVIVLLCCVVRRTPVVRESNTRRRVRSTPVRNLDADVSSSDESFETASVVSSVRSSRSQRLQRGQFVSSDEARPSVRWTNRDSIAGSGEQSLHEPSFALDETPRNISNVSSSSGSVGPKYKCDPPERFKVGMDIHAWFESFRIWAELNGTRVCDIKRLLMSRMSPDAANIVRFLFDGRVIFCYEDAREQLLSMFDPSSCDASNLKAEFYKRVQFSDEAVASFLADLCRWCERVFANEADYAHQKDEWVKCQFLHGLHDQGMKYHVMQRAKYGTLAEAYQEALVYAKTYGTARQQRVYYNTYAAKCETTKGKVPVWKPDFVDRKGRSFDGNDVAKENKLVNVTCYRCGERGHKANNCSRKDGVGSMKLDSVGATPKSNSNLSSSTTSSSSSSKPVNSGLMSSKPNVSSQAPSDGKKSFYVQLREEKPLSITSLVRLEDENVNVLVDTGSDISLMSDKLFRRICSSSSRSFDLKPVTFNITSCETDKQLWVLGSFRCRVTVNDFDELCEFVVVKNLAQECLFGMNILIAWPDMRRALILMLRACNKDAVEEEHILLKTKELAEIGGISKLNESINSLMVGPRVVVNLTKFGSKAVVGDSLADLVCDREVKPTVDISEGSWNHTAVHDTLVEKVSTFWNRPCDARSEVCQSKCVLESPVSGPISDIGAVTMEMINNVSLIEDVEVVDGSDCMDSFCDLSMSSRQCAGVECFM